MDDRQQSPPAGEETPSLKARLADNPMAVGVAIGLTLGVLAGMAFDAVSTSLFLGLLVGLAIGAVLRKVFDRRQPGDPTGL